MMLSLKELPIQWGGTNTIKQVTRTPPPSVAGALQAQQGSMLRAGLEAPSDLTQGRPSLNPQFNFQHEFTFSSQKYLERFSPAFLFVSFLVTKEKKNHKVVS